MNITVFLADDHAVVLDGLKSLLEHEVDIRVTGTARDGKIAVSRITELKPDIAILDIAMPDLNGIDAVGQVRERSPSTRCIILSMHSSSEHIFRAFQAGAKGYLLKDSAGSEIAHAIRTVYSGGRCVSQKISEIMIDNYILRQDIKPDEKSPLEKLSAREREILQFVAEGKSSADIAKILFLSPKTVDTYRSRLMKKLGIHDIPTLIRFALQHGIIT